MKSEIGEQIGAVTRAVEDREHAGRPARAVVASRSYSTTIADVWDAVTSPERIPRWFLPISGDLRLGGRYQLEGNAGGEITGCEPPRLLRVTWEFGGQVSWLEVDLEVVAEEETRLELRHIAPVDEHWEQFGPGAVGVGWDLTLLGLGQFLASGAEFDREAAEAWSASAEGKEVLRMSSDRWCDAAIAAGTEEAAARAAAKRTAAFYTGEGAE